MAGTNPTPVVDDDALTTEEDLRKLKYPDEEVETTEVEDETSEESETEEESEEVIEDDGQTDGQETEEEAEAETPAFVKEFDYIKGDTPEEYAKNLEAAYKNSSSEALRLKSELDKTAQAPSISQSEITDDEEAPTKTVTDLFVQQQLDKEIQTAWVQTQKEYPQASDPAEYAKFRQKVGTFSRTILDSEKRLASPVELYNMAAISLGWEKKTAEPDSKEKLAMAAKDGAASGKTSSGPTKPQPTKPKISEAQLKLNRKMYPGKTDQEIIDELTPYL